MTTSGMGRTNVSTFVLFVQTRLLTLLKGIATTDGKWIIDNVRPIYFLYTI